MLTSKSYTRITLSLDILQKLKDGPYAGYHELGIIKHAIDLHDTISIEETETTQVTCTNPAVPCDSRNICWQAVDLCKKQFGVDKNVSITIEKNIPVMGGLAGGSTNAATTLLLLNQLWRLNLAQEKLLELGRSLGMDVPFYFFGQTAYDTEATGVLQPIATSAQFAFVLVMPDFGVSTKEAYQNIDYTLIGKQKEKTESLRRALEENDYPAIARNCHNDFELSVFRSQPKLATIKKSLLEAGCDAAFMSGSGSTMIGLVENSDSARTIAANLPHRTLVSITHSELALIENQ